MEKRWGPCPSAAAPPRPSLPLSAPSHQPRTRRAQSRSPAPPSPHLRRFDLMALCHLPRPPLFNSRELHVFPPAAKLAVESLRWDATQRSLACTALLLSCSAKKPRASRKSRSAKSNAELCNELREFVSAAGLPEHHVPSAKELLEHGRKDLANIVRRRGYKELTRLLLSPMNGDTSSVKTLANDNCFSKVSTEEPFHTFTEDQATQDNLYNLPADSLHEGAVSCSQNGEVETVGDSLESEDTVIHNGHELSPTMDSTNGVDDGAVGTQLSSPLPRGQNSIRDDVASEESLGHSDFNKHRASDLAEERTNQAEISHLKELLHKKETELVLLKQLIEEEKFALSVMQSKVHSETSKVQNIISTKDKELHEAEEKLSGLKEVLIKYWGNGETVEVAGSFNGWQHRIKMDPHTSSTTADQTAPRDAILWSAILWLYPGIYEIKFVVDGHWRIDSRHKIVTRGDIMNNVIRVES